MKFAIFQAVCLAMLVAIVHYQAYEKGFEDGVRSVPKPTPTPAMTLLQKDEMCSAWLFNTDLLKAKKRVCGGRG